MGFSPSLPFSIYANAGSYVHNPWVNHQNWRADAFIQFTDILLTWVMEVCFQCLSPPAPPPQLLRPICIFSFNESDIETCLVDRETCLGFSMGSLCDLSNCLSVLISQPKKSCQLATNKQKSGWRVPVPLIAAWSEGINSWNFHSVVPSWHGWWGCCYSKNSIYRTQKNKWPNRGIVKMNLNIIKAFCNSK